MTETVRGRVVASYSSDSIVEGPDGELLRCLSKRSVGKPYCGDYVRWRRTGEHEGAIEAIEPRRSFLARPNYRGDLQGFAANVDLMVIVSAVRPPLDPGLIDRYLVLAESLGLDALVYINKIDLAEDAEHEALLSQLAEYAALGYPTLTGSTQTGAGIEELEAALKGRTSILVGQSGVGKSSLVQRLLPDLELRIGALSHASGQGRHTTTETTLYHLETGGDLIDSPGIRTLRLGHLSSEDIAQGFVELRPYLGQCRFADCKHRGEPDCALAAAYEDGKITPRRWESYHEVVQAEEKDRR